jgi:hypothetical protein
MTRFIDGKLPHSFSGLFGAVDQRCGLTMMMFFCALQEITFVVYFYVMCSGVGLGFDEKTVHL